MTRREREEVRSRTAAAHHAQEKRLNQRAFDRDFDRISSRFDDGMSEPRQTRENGMENLPPGTRLRDVRTGRVYELP